MKSGNLMFIAVALSCVAGTALAGQTQQVAPNEVPEGITAEDWGIVQEAYLKASNTDAEDGFGHAVAISGDTVAITSLDDSAATGVNGNQLDNSASGSGAVYVFVRNGTTWSQQAYLKASNTDAGDVFGWAVAISGDTIVVGAKQERSNATGVNGNQADNSAVWAGAAYVFVRDGTTWSQQAYLKASNTDAYDRFGSSVGISGGTIVVGAPYECGSATGVNGNQNDNSVNHSGAAYVFVRNGSMWSQQAYLKSSTTSSSDSFGCSVAISEDTIVVGDYDEAADVFVRNGTAWSQQTSLSASYTGWYDDFGTAVAISGDTIVVGASGESSSATGVNGNQDDNSLGGAGAAYVFVRSGTTWSQQAYLKASNSGESDRFGCSVAISSDAIVVGANTERSSATGVNGEQSDNSAGVSGAAYAFVRNGTTWSQQAYLKASNTGGSDMFGSSVAISGDIVVIGSDGEDSAATGINGNQADNSADYAGSAYVFTGFGTPGSATITACTPVASGFTLEWIPVPGWHSVVKCSTDLVNTPFTDLSATLPYPVNSYTDTVSNGTCFYRVDLEP